jgi:hypothetical protein
MRNVIDYCVYAAQESIALVSHYGGRRIPGQKQQIQPFKGKVPLVLGRNCQSATTQKPIPQTL